MSHPRTNPIIQPGVECRVCLGPHGKKQHARTVKLHAWFREDLLRRIQPPAIAVKPKTTKPGFGRTPLIIDEAALAEAQAPESTE